MWAWLKQFLPDYLVGTALDQFLDSKWGKRFQGWLVVAVITYIGNVAAWLSGLSPALKYISLGAAGAFTLGTIVTGTFAIRDKRRADVRSPSPRAAPRERATIVRTPAQNEAETATRFPPRLMERLNGELTNVYLKLRRGVSEVSLETGMLLRDAIEELERTFAYNDHDLHQPVRDIVERSLNEAKKTLDGLAQWLDGGSVGSSKNTIAERINFAQQAFENGRTEFVDFYRDLRSGKIALGQNLPSRANSPSVEAGERTSELRSLLLATMAEIGHNEKLKAPAPLDERFGTDEPLRGWLDEFLENVGRYNLGSEGTKLVDALGALSGATDSISPTKGPIRRSPFNLLEPNPYSAAAQRARTAINDYLTGPGDRRTQIVLGEGAKTGDIHNLKCERDPTKGGLSLSRVIRVFPIGRKDRWHIDLKAVFRVDNDTNRPVNVRTALAVVDGQGLTIAGGGKGGHFEKWPNIGRPGSNFQRLPQKEADIGSPELRLAAYEVVEACLVHNFMIIPTSVADSITDKHKLNLVLYTNESEHSESISIDRRAALLNGAEERKRRIGTLG